MLIAPGRVGTRMVVPPGVVTGSVCLAAEAEAGTCRTGRPANLEAGVRSVAIKSMTSVEPRSNR